MEKELYDLTAPQKSIWLTEQYYKNTNINNVCGVFFSPLPLNFTVLEKVLKSVVKNNESFRTRLLLKDGQIKQYFEEYSDFEIETVLINSNEEKKELEKNLNKNSFDLLNSPLFKFTMYKFPDNHGGYILNSNHIISDSWSSGIIANEISNTYSLIMSNQSFEKSSELSYSTYIKTEQEYLKSEKFQKDKQYWNSIYSTIPEIATIPSVKENNNSKISYKANRLLVNIDIKKLNKIKQYANEQKISLYNLFMGVFSLYLGRVSSIDDFSIGTPILNRTNFKEKQITGMFVNVLPLRINLNHEQKFKDFISKISINSMGLLRHQRYSYNYILEDLRKKDSSLPGLYNVLLSYQITKMNENNENLPHTASWVFNESISNDLELHIFEWNDNNSLQIAYDYKTDKYSEKEMSDIHERILHVLDQIINNENILLKEIEIVTPKEKNKILYEFNNTKVDYPKDKTIADLFEEQVEKTPDNIAVAFEDQKLTYMELNEKANSLAHLLRNNFKIKRNDIVGIMVPRSLEMIIAILATLKSGACYIPIDPEYPQDRIEYMLEDSNSKLLLTFKKLDNKVNFENKLFIELNNNNFNKNTKNLNNINTPDDLAYIIYTSGSTGKPKGVMLTHKSLSNLTFYCNESIEYLKNNIYRSIVSITTISFDIFIFETLISLQKGLKLVIANENEQTIPRLLNNLINKHNVVAIQATPSRMQLLLNNINEIPNLSNIKFITLAGEQLPKSLLYDLIKLGNPTIYNGYGPSETTVFSTLTNVTNYKDVTIGKPLNNTQIYILDSNLNICPINTPRRNLYFWGWCWFRISQQIRTNQ